MPEHNPRQRLFFDVLERRLLDFGKPPYLGLGELDVLDVSCGHATDAIFDLIVRELETRRRPAIVFRGQLPHGGIAPGLDVGENSLNGRFYLRILLRGGFGIDAAFDDFDHCLLP